MFTQAQVRARARQGRAAVAAAVLLAGLLAAGTGVQAAGRGGLFAGLYRTVCRYNVALAEQAYQLFQLQRGRDPHDLDELARERFVRPPRCPAGGVLRLGPDGTVTCSVHDRQSLRVTSIGTHRTWPFTGQTPQAHSFRRTDQAVYFLAAWEPDGQKHAVEVRWTDAEERTVQSDRFTDYAKSEVATALSLAGRSAAQLPPGEYRAKLVLDGETAASTVFWVVN